MRGYVCMMEPTSSPTAAQQAAAQHNVAFPVCRDSYDGPFGFPDSGPKDLESLEDGGGGAMETPDQSPLEATFGPRVAAPANIQQGGMKAVGGAQRAGKRQATQGIVDWSTAKKERKGSVQHPQPEAAVEGSKRYKQSPPKRKSESQSPHRKGASAWHTRDRQDQRQYEPHASGPAAEASPGGQFHSHSDGHALKMWQDKSAKLEHELEARGEELRVTQAQHLEASSERSLLLKRVEYLSAAKAQLEAANAALEKESEGLCKKVCSLPYMLRLSV
jgi:hypothetical protein